MSDALHHRGLQPLKFPKELGHHLPNTAPIHIENSMTLHPLLLLSSFLILSLSTTGCTDDPDESSDCRAIVAAESCPVGTAPQIHQDLPIQGSCDEGFFIDEVGNAQGICKIADAPNCSFVCKQVIGCPCGIQKTTAEAVECRVCSTACGDGVCDSDENAITGAEGYCPSDCGSTCLISEMRCNGDLRQSCNGSGAWEDLPCPTGTPLCQGGGACIAGESSCTDEIQNGNETGVDCGGVCSACTPLTCSDGIQNEDESGIDCGGLCPVCDDMIRVPLSEISLVFEMGTPNTEECRESDELPFHHVTLNSFDIDTYEVTAAEYDACVDAGVCVATKTGEGFTSRDPEKTDHPINSVDWDDALIYCGWVNKRLPTEAEWELAAKGETHRLFPWGDDCPASWDALCCDAPEWTASTAKSNCAQDSCNDLYPGTAPVGSFPEGVSPYGVHDMAGNVAEWTADFYDPLYYASGPPKNPKGPFAGLVRVLRGGSWSLDGIHHRSSNRNNAAPTNRGVDLGFRCADSF